MKILKRSALMLLLGSLVLPQTGCFGEFALTRKLYDWHDGVSEQKFVKSLIFWLTSIAYVVTTFVDFVILNLIEFWSGTNPLSMNEGDHEMQLVTLKGVDYRIDATMDTFTTTQLTGEQAGEVRIMKFDRSTRTWRYSDSRMCEQPLITFLDAQASNVRIYTSNGSVDLALADLQEKDQLLARFNGCSGPVLASAE